MATGGKNLMQRVRAAVTAFRGPKTKAFFSQRSGFLRNLWVFNGEKTLGELGPERDYFVDLASFRARGKQFYLDNEVAQMIVNRMAAWIIGNGLRLEAEPNEAALASEGIKISVQQFSDLVEARYSTLKESKETSFSRMRNLSQEEKRAFIASCNGGGMLVVLRVKNGIVNYELIDGAHIKHPAGGNDLNPTLLDNGGRISNGIELDAKGEHVAYWVLDARYEYRRISAKSASTGLTMAFLYGGIDYSLDSTQTIPLLSGLFQTLSQMDSYKVETLGSAKSQNSQAYQIVTEVDGDNDNPLAGTVALAQNWVDPAQGNIPTDSYGVEMANKVSAETGKNAWALAKGQRIEPVMKNEAELYFKDFWTALFEVVCAAAGIPPNVAAQRFDTSFSSARAAIKDWEHTLLLQRYSHGINFLQPGYELQLHLDILTGKVSAPGYLKAFSQNNVVVLSAYRQTRWVGDNVPHIDPLKEVQAERMKLGDLGATLPLTTQKKATEALNGGSSKSNTEDFSEEKKTAEGLGIKPEPVATPVGGGSEKN